MSLKSRSNTQVDDVINSQKTSRDSASLGLEFDESHNTDTNITWTPTTHELLIMLSLSSVSLMISLDATIIITALPTIVSDLHGTTTFGFWLGTSYLLASASPMLFIAALSGIFGRPPCLLVSLASFTIGSIICSTGRSFAALLTGRCIQGIGGGGLVILSLIIVTDIVPLRHRPKYYGIVQAAWALGSVVGPLLGGVFAQRTTWRWIFYLMFPFCGIGFATLPWLLTLKVPKTSLKDKLIRIDWIGGLLSISSTTAILIAISWGGTQEPWQSFRTILPLVSGLLGMIGTLAWEKLGAYEPFLQKDLFHCFSSFAIYAGAVVQGLLLYGGLYYYPLYFLAVKSSSPTRAGVCLLPILLTLIPTSIIVGVLITRSNRFRWAIWLGWAITTLGSGLTIVFDVKTSTATWATMLIILGMGHGLLLSSQNFAAQAICFPKDEEPATAMYAYMRGFGMAIGVGIGGSIFQNVMKHKLRQMGLPADIADNSMAYIATLRSLSNNSAAKAQVLDAYVSGLQGVYGGFTALSGLAGIASIFIGKFDMNRRLVSNHKLRGHRWLKRASLPTSITPPQENETIV